MKTCLRWGRGGGLTVTVPYRDWDATVQRLPQKHRNICLYMVQMIRRINIRFLGILPLPLWPLLLSLVAAPAHCYGSYPFCTAYTDEGLYPPVCPDAFIAAAAAFAASLSRHSRRRLHPIRLSDWFLNRLNHTHTQAMPMRNEKC